MPTPSARCSATTLRPRWSSSATSRRESWRRRSSPRPGSTCPPSPPSRAPSRGGGRRRPIDQFTDNPAADAFTQYLTTAEAGEIRAERRLLVAEQHAEHGRLPRRDHAHHGGRPRRGAGFPVRHVRPAAVGIWRHSGRGLFQHFTDFVQNPSDIDGITQKMAADAARHCRRGRAGRR